MTLCFIDTETTSLRPDRRVWEVAMIVRNDSACREVSFYIDTDLSGADPAALRIGGFYDRHPMGRALAGRPPAMDEDDEMMSEAEAADIIAAYTHGATLVGSNPAFDAEALARLIRDAGLVPAWSHRLRDVATLASGYLRRDVGGLDGALDALDIEVPESVRHTAMGDAAAAKAVYDAILGGDR